jgi:hypothetical protein
MLTTMANNALMLNVAVPDGVEAIAENAERDPQCITLRRRNSLQPIQQRRAQLVQRGKRKLHL